MTLDELPNAVQSPRERIEAAIKFIDANNSIAAKLALRHALHLLDKPPRTDPNQDLWDMMEHIDKTYGVGKVTADLDKLAKLGHPDDPRTEVMQAAADMLRKIPSVKDCVAPLESEDYKAVGYRVDIDSSEGRLRMVFFREHDNKIVLAYMELETHEVYDLASHLLREYDKLEGIDK